MHSARSLRELAEFIALEQSVGMTVKARNARSIKHLHGEMKAKEVVPQGRLEDTKLEKRFIKALEKAIDECLEKQGYFTDAQLAAKTDPDGKMITTKSARKHKEELIPTYRPALVEKKGLTKDRVNKETRQRFNIPASINSSTHIYYKK